MKDNKLFAALKRADNKIYIADYIIFGVIAVFCYLVFMQGDILVTGNRAWQFYNSNFFNYYDVLQKWTNDNGATYLPTTFLFFAVWLLPLKILGFAAPETLMTSHFIYNMWYKLLPTCFFFITALFIYKLAVIIGMSKNKSKVCAASFVTLPVAFFNQFIFSQYDIFTVFFMVLGLYFFFRNKKFDKCFFCLSFGVAITFKYYAILIFLVFLLLKEKRIIDIAKYGLCSLWLLIIEIACFYPSKGFRDGVFGFGALTYVSQEDFTTILGSVSYFQILVMFIVIWAYFVKPKDTQDLIKWGFYLSCGVCFAQFALMTWHPQWLLFGAPFWVISASFNKNTKKFLWLDCLYTYSFYAVVLTQWTGNVDSQTMRYGILGKIFGGNAISRFACEFYPNPGKNMMLAVLFVVLLSFFVFKHPKFTLEDLSYDDGEYNIWLLRLRLWLAFLLYAGPCFISFLFSVGIL